MDKRVELITRNCKEVLTLEELEERVASKKRMSAYLGRAITGPLHMGHLVSLSKMVDLQRADVEPIILLADIHAVLDDQKSTWEDLEPRREYTQKAISLALDWDRQPRFVKGSDFQLSKEYEIDIFKIATMATVKTSLHAASEVTRMKNPKVSELIYPIMQALDEQYLGVDIQVGGADQRHIMTFAREYLPMLGYRKNIELMMPLIPSLKGPGVKMSSSVEGSVIKVNASEEEIKAVIRDAYCPVGAVEDNPIFEIASQFIFPLEGKITIARDSKFGGDLEIRSEAELKDMFTAKKLHPADLKAYVAGYLTRRLKRVREYFESNQDLIKQLGPRFQ